MFSYWDIFSNQLVFDLESPELLEFQAKPRTLVNLDFPMSRSQGKAAFEACTGSNFIRGNIRVVFLLNLNRSTAKSLVTQFNYDHHYLLCPPGNQCVTGIGCADLPILMLNHSAVFTFPEMQLASFSQIYSNKVKPSVHQGTPVNQSSQPEDIRGKPQHFFLGIHAMIHRTQELKLSQTYRFRGN